MENKKYKINLKKQQQSNKKSKQTKKTKQETILKK